MTDDPKLERMASAYGGDWEPTICAECESLFIVNPKDGYWRWLCTKVKRAAWFNPVNGQTAADPPYAFCKDLNDGNCAMFKAGINSLSPDKLAKPNLAGEARKLEVK
jgi:hypothetical protein